MTRTPISIANSTAAAGTRKCTLDALIVELAAQFERQGFKPERYETHISSVLLVGDHAYKFKKPVDFGFLDFSTLALRKKFCEREVDLNRRFAPLLYRGVVAVTRGESGVLEVDGPGPVLDYAVSMQRFASDQQLDRRFQRGALSDADCESLGRMLGEAHAGAARAGGAYGTVEMALRHMQEATIGLKGRDRRTDDVLARYTSAANAALDALATRHRDGYIRDCHGDLHLSNIVCHGGCMLLFDCIEFNDELRYIDTMSDFAFLFMDLAVRGGTPSAYAVLNAYLAACGDYGGLQLLMLYAAYRSVVRAKVAVLSRTTAPFDSAATECEMRATRHVALAERLLSSREPATLSITHGLSGSGKSWLSRRLAASEAQIHLRSDIERRRLAGVAPRGTSASALDRGLYTADITAATYARLEQLSRTVLGAGYSVIVDAAFLRKYQRERFCLLASELGVPFRILDCDAPRALLETRIQQRAERGDDASEATLEVLDHQIASREPLTAAERECVRSDDATATSRPANSPCLDGKDAGR